MGWLGEVERAKGDGLNDVIACKTGVDGIASIPQRKCILLCLRILGWVTISSPPQRMPTRAMIITRLVRRGNHPVGERLQTKHHVVSVGRSEWLLCTIAVTTQSMPSLIDRMGDATEALLSNDKSLSTGSQWARRRRWM